MIVEQNQVQHVFCLELVIELIRRVLLQESVNIFVADSFLGIRVADHFEKEVAFKLGAPHQPLAELLNMQLRFTNELKYFKNCFHNIFFRSGVLPRALAYVEVKPSSVELLHLIL